MDRKTFDHMLAALICSGIVVASGFTADFCFSS